MNFNAVTAIFLTELFVLVASSCVIVIRYRELQQVKHKSTADIGYIIASLIWIFSLTAHTASMLVHPESAQEISSMDAIAWAGFCIGTLILLFLQLENKDVREKRLENAPTSALASGDADSQFFHTSRASFLLIDSQHNVEDANLSATRLLGIGKLRGSPLSTLIAEEDRQIVNQLTYDKLIGESEDYSIEARFNSDSDEPRWIKLVPQPLDGNKKNLLLLLQDISETKSLAELLDFHSHYDELTMLNNRAGLEKYLADAFKTKHGKDNISISLVYIDIDQLKVVNDTCGHAAGDNLIQQLVAIINDASESFDFFARLGGDEFALVKHGCDKATAKNLAEKIRSAAEDFVFTWKHNHYRQSVSIGVATSSAVLNDVISLIGAADAACYTAKKNGRNRVVMYADNTAATSYDSHKEVMWVSRLQKAIQDGAFVLYFQPIEKLKDEAHVHYELLIRYVDDDGNHISPMHFLPAVERFGLSEQIDLWVLTTALDYLDKHPSHTEMLNCCSINLTTQSIANPRIRSAILQVVQSYNFPRDKICFEITESSAIQNLSEAQDFVNELKTLGCHLALDDFGTGFASFDYLKNLEVDYIKIDGSFVKDIITDRFDRAMVSAINNIGKEMGIEIIAEYAETDKILDTLYDMGIDYAQGHAIAKPQPIDQIEPYYADKVSFTKKMEAN